MVRVVLFLLWFSVILYALADWVRVAADEMPGRLPKPLWFVVIIMTAPTFGIGALAWIVLRVVQRVEARQGGTVGASSLAEDIVARWRGSVEPVVESSVAPDDDPEFLFKLERDIARRRAEERREKERAERSFNTAENMSEKFDESAENSDFPDAENDADGNSDNS